MFTSRMSSAESDKKRTQNVQLRQNKYEFLRIYQPYRCMHSHRIWKRLY